MTVRGWGRRCYTEEVGGELRKTAFSQIAKIQGKDADKRNSSTELSVRLIVHSCLERLEIKYKEPKMNII